MKHHNAREAKTATTPRTTIPIPSTKEPDQIRHNNKKVKPETNTLQT
jgi:hypothetical protein